MEPSQRYNLCLELTRQYGELLKEARKIRRSSDFEVSYPPAMRRYQANQEDQQRINTTISIVCRQQPMKTPERTEEPLFNIDFNELFIQIHKPK